MGLCPADLVLDEEGWSDPLMMSNDDGELIDRIIEVLILMDTEDIPDWWRKKMEPYIIEALLVHAESINCGVVYNKDTHTYFVDELRPWPVLSVVFGGK